MTGAPKFKKWSKATKAIWQKGCRCHS